MQSISEMIQPIKWHSEQLHLLDQRLLPLQQVWLGFDYPEDVSNAIREMVVRGAPAIGVTAAYAVVLAAREAWNKAGINWKQAMIEPLAKLAASRPTAVNLTWAIEKMTAVYLNQPETYSAEAALLEAAIEIHQHDIRSNQTMGKLGADLIDADSTVLTHCNAGALATGGFGTALGVIRQGFADDKIKHVYVDETRPWLQGARLTAWELMQDNIPCTLQADVAAAALMASGQIDWIIVGADRIAANGDVANKIGTYSLAVLAKYHQVKVMVVAPLSTIDWQTASGKQIPIEQRPSSEVTHVANQQIAPEGINVVNPAFDVTPAELINAIVTEAGVVLSPSTSTMKNLHKQN
ncbi:S-methyl-5-thioribose-1-phosphate isomerase [Methylophaga pinxianii]|uniref:S-methyl-5-thioribose-1-phosphate isomerase n=1 Tax=Methylophaga pinxianii TaxID=2881052 RepID=UPI001CF24E37|nr:S-methyl-5-thioribose-1-phosphate isomerase [Methylophaga pinxianii]MCB2426587.1 S-methyl-5-thioribose-1-phosphate isomerase [Methylophaga pinxianii]UPH45516.1 S-methyl-5-thioribose-1-phosphate isomerase [Methylophaga pinxianii]